MIPNINHHIKYECNKMKMLTKNKRKEKQNKQKKNKKYKPKRNKNRPCVINNKWKNNKNNDMMIDSLERTA